MPAATAHTLACLKAHLIAQDAAQKPGTAFRSRPATSGTFRSGEFYRVLVAPRFAKWITEWTPPNVRVHQAPEYVHAATFDFTDARTERKLMVDPTEQFAKYHPGTLIHHAYVGLRRVGEREGSDGWGVPDDLRYVDADSRDLLHWITDPERRKHVFMHLLNGSTLVFSFRSPAHDFEFKNRFGV